MCGPRVVVGTRTDTLSMLCACVGYPRSSWHRHNPDELRTASGHHPRVRKLPSAGYPVPAAVAQINRTCHYAQASCSDRDVYEFGVFTGRSMRGLAIGLNSSQLPFRKFWGFDSFVGLPQESAVANRSGYSARDWQPGSFSAAEALRDKSFRSVERAIKKYIDDPRVEFVRGFYDDSLTPSLAADLQMRAAIFVMIDCDLYASAFAALDWMASNKLIVNGTLLCYNDWGAGGADGERRAHEEMVARHNMRVQLRGRGGMQSYRPGVLFNVIFEVVCVDCG